MAEAVSLVPLAPCSSNSTRLPTHRVQQMHTLKQHYASSTELWVVDKTAAGLPWQAGVPAQVSCSTCLGCGSKGVVQANQLTMTSQLLCGDRPSAHYGSTALHTAVAARQCQHHANNSCCVHIISKRKCALVCDGVKYQAQFQLCRLPARGVLPLLRLHSRLMSAHKTIS